MTKSTDYELGETIGDEEEHPQDRWDALKELEIRIVKAIIDRKLVGTVPAPEPVF